MRDNRMRASSMLTGFIFRVIVVMLMLQLTVVVDFNQALAAPPDPGGGELQKGPVDSSEVIPPMDDAQERKPVKNSKLDSVLTLVEREAQESTARALEFATQKALRVEGEQIQVQIGIARGEAVAATEMVNSVGGEVTGESLDGTVLQAWLPVGSIGSLSLKRGIQMIRAPHRLIEIEDLAVGSSTTEALSVMNAVAWQAEGYTGEGVKVAVVDGGFLGYPGLLGGDLPASVTVKNFVDGESDADVDGTTEHGTACAEIIHDIAPDAELFLVKISTNIDLQEAVIWLRDTHQVDVISTSMGWYNVTPGDGTGFFADLVDSAHSAGIVWATAAGNDRRAHWGGPYYDADSDGDHDFDESQDINYFGPGDSDAYYIPSGLLLRVYLRWDDWTNVDQDYDLYLYQWDDINGWWELVAYSEEYQDGTPGKTPTEQITYVTADEYGVDDGYGFYGFLISRWDSDRAVNLEVFAPKVDRLDEIVTARSLANLADSPNAMTVAALDVTSPYPQEPYSSEGPTNGPGGTAGGGATKPDISGFANVSTESYAPAVFNGTSAATPHAAGAAALVIDAHPSWTPDEVEAFLTGRAVDMGSSGMDNLFGHGRLTLGDPPAAPMTLGPPADFDGDGDTDVSVFRPANGRWYIYGEPAFNWGLTGDIPAPADYDGDGDAEATVFRPGNGRWYVLGDPSRMYGMGGDVPVPCDYDGDGEAEIAVFRPANGRWYVLGEAATTWGKDGDMPLPGDYDGDGACERAVFRPSNGRWYIEGEAAFTWGLAGDLPVPGDYDGDGSWEAVVFRPGNGRWYIQGQSSFMWGVGGDIPVSGDFDADGSWEVAVFRPSNGRWYVREGFTRSYGMDGDFPLPSMDTNGDGDVYH